MSDFFLKRFLFGWLFGCLFCFVCLLLVFFFFLFFFPLKKKKSGLGICLIVCYCFFHLSGCEEV